MPVSKSKAEGGIKALTGAKLFDMLQKNICIHDKSHWSEENARSAVNGGKTTCGFYFKKSTSTAFEHTGTGERVERLSKRAKKSQWKRVEVVSKLPVAASDCATLCSSALSSQSGALFKAPSNGAENRFVYFRPLASAYGGETLRRGGGSEACEYICIVLAFGPAIAIVTHFPASQSYADGLDDLT